MNVLYHLTVLPPKLPQAEAYAQEITALRTHFGGDLVYLNPNQQSSIPLPRLLFGLHKVRAVRLREANLDLHHIYNPDPFPFPVLRWLRRPVVYCLTGDVTERQRVNVDFFNRLAAVVVYDEGTLDRLRARGLHNGWVVHPGIDTSRFTHNPRPLTEEISLLVASAPWTPAQFQSKGVDALLATAQQMPNLHLTFLWRGVLADAMMTRVAQAGLGARVTVIDRVVDVNAELARAHGTIALATHGGIIKAYPHSLLDSLAAGKPVLVSRAIPMARYVEETRCGGVVEQVTVACIANAIDQLVANYGYWAQVARQVGPRDFSQERMITSVQKIYEQVCQ